MKYLHIGYCNTDTRNKVWGVVQLTDNASEIELIYGMKDYGPGRRPDKFLTFWGRAGTKIQTKVWEGRDWEATDKFKLKKSEGYKRIVKSRLDKISPGATEAIEKTACFLLLSL